MAPVPCGAHRGIGIGTHKALLSLGASTYVEVLAPDPEQVGLGGRRFGPADSAVRAEPVALTRRRPEGSRSHRGSRDGESSPAGDSLACTARHFEDLSINSTCGSPVDLITPRRARSGRPDGRRARTSSAVPLRSAGPDLATRNAPNRCSTRGRLGLLPSYSDAARSCRLKRPDSAGSVDMNVDRQLRPAGRRALASRESDPNGRDHVTQAARAAPSLHCGSGAGAHR